MELGTILRYYRALHNLTQSEVAELAGINEKYLGRIERGESVPTIDKVEQLCHAFDIRLCDMLMVSPDRMPVQRTQATIRNIPSKPKEIYYCNCCGCVFQQEAVCGDDNEIRCPECGCLFDSENGFIEKSVIQ